jgi:hypothetical protein
VSFKVHGWPSRMTSRGSTTTKEISKDLEFIVVDRARVLQKWGPDGMPIAGETRFLEPKEKWPDVDAMNEEAPKSEWRDGPNGLQGPWQCQHVIYLLDPQTLDKFTYPTNTVGGHICVGDLSDRIKNMRRLRGAHVYPVVTLSDTFMNTRHGGRERPHFVIKRWVMLGPSETALPAPPEGPRPLDTAAAAETSAPIELQTVKEPTLSEEMGGDAVPYNDALSADLGGTQTAPAPTPHKPAAQKPRITKRGVQKIARGR